jgi:hypothetical protein
MAKKNADEEPETCIWCRPGSTALKPDADRQREKANNKVNIASTAQNSDDDEPEMTWISCTRCKTWYHADCVALQELVSKVGGKEGDAPDPFTEPGSSGSLPPEAINELRNQGMSWDWTGSVDKWCVYFELRWLFLPNDLLPLRARFSHFLQVLHTLHNQSIRSESTPSPFNDQQRLLLPLRTARRTATRLCAAAERTVE